MIGGLLGSSLRLALDTAIPHTDESFPLSTLIANVVGAFILGFVVARVWSRVATWLRAGLGVGLLGSFTTFSAVSVSLVTLADSGQWMTAALYLAITLLGGLSAAAAGLILGRGRAPMTPLDEVNE